MSATSVTARGRVAAESLMVDTGVITRGAAPTFDPNTGLLTDTGTTVHSGPCRLRQPSAAEAEVLFGEEQLTTTRFIACFPHDVTGVQIDDVITITESDDADALTRQFRVVAIPIGTFVLYKGFGCEVAE